MNNIQILIIDYGSQYTLVIGRTIRELGVRSIILSPLKASKWLAKNNPKAVILSGSNWSVYSPKAPGLPSSLDTTGKKYTILGICYGMQLLAYKFGGKVEKPHLQREYGPIKVKINNNHPLFKKVSKITEVWASHGDTITKLPKNYTSIATSQGISAMVDKSNRIFGVQFHPEVSETKEGKKILNNFIILSSCIKDWNPLDLISYIQNETLNIVGKKKKLILGVSGGVDSTTLARVLNPVFKERLICVAIDTGGLREGELEELKKNVLTTGIKKVKIINASDDFIKNISTTTDAELKRKKFREVYKKIFEEQIKKFKANFIVQGTLATDIIESGQVGKSAKIKTHHNVGLNFKVEELHPFRNLFKYEVRELGRVLGLSNDIYNRNPFPGPGLFLRIVGLSVTKERIKLVREADQTVRNILKKNKLEKEISQLIVALIGINSVGVKGDERVYGYSLVIRAVQTADFMTARGYYFNNQVVNEIINTLTKHKEIVRVFFDMTPKPPATTEFE